MLVSISEGFCLEGLLAAILFKAGDDILAAPSGDGRLLSRCVVGVDVVVVPWLGDFDFAGGKELWKGSSEGR